MFKNYYHLNTFNLSALHKKIYDDSYIIQHYPCQIKSKIYTIEIVSKYNCISFLFIYIRKSMHLF